MAKNENEKHDHKWTKLLKVGIFAAMMLAPLFAIGVKCAYVSINKNAHENYSGENYNVYQDINEIELNKQYHFTSEPNSTSETNIFSGYISYNDIKNIDTSLTNIKNYLLEGAIFSYYTRVNFKQIYIYDNQLNQLGNALVNNNTLQFDFNLIGYQENYVQNIYPNIKTIQKNNYYYMDNVFYYAIDQMKENELFNWTRNTAIYNGVNAVTTGLGITTDAIPILLVYWILLTLIYVIFDIVIETFTWLTHLFSNKVIK